MPFEKFKERHGGEGPFQVAYGALFPEGILGRRGLAGERELTDELVGQIRELEDVQNLEGLLAAAEQPLTRDQHAAVRSALTQAVVDQRTINDGYSAFQEQQASLRSRMVTKNDEEQLGVMDSQMAYAHKLLKSGNAELEKAGTALAAKVLDAQMAYATTNEAQRLQLEVADADRRNERRKEIQSFVDARFVAPAIEDRANFAAISQQLATGKGEEVAPAALVSSVLDYAGAQLRAVDGGNWSFSFGGLGLEPDKVPQMTFSQLRNQLNAAHQGRQQSLQGGIGQYMRGAAEQGFGINGTRVSDLLFPLADAAYAEREEEHAPPSVLESSGPISGEHDPVSVVRDTVKGIGSAYSGAREGVADALTWMFGPDEVDYNVFRPKRRTGGQFGAGEESGFRTGGRITND